MNLKLNLNGCADPFINYLKSYARIRDSLLLEIDTKKQAFIAKVFTEDRSSVRFSSITFSDANISVVSDDGESVRGDNRIKVAILIQLPKFIRMLSRFGSDVNDKGESNFMIEVCYDSMISQSDAVDYAATSVVLRSSVLKMKMDGFRLSELRYLDDDTFTNVVFNVSDPVSFVLSAAEMEAIIKTSEIIKIDPRRDVLIFFANGHDVFVKDQPVGKSKDPNFEYKLGTLDCEPFYEVSAKVSREKFIKMLDKSSETFKVTIGRSMRNGEPCVSRILFDSTDSSTKVVISTTNE